MSEGFLHYIWQHQYFDKSNLTSTEGSEITILKTGYHNKDAGPDFKQAKITFDNIEWVGHVEIHRKSSDWYAHNHHNDTAYESTVLHVVLEDDKLVKRADGTSIPTVELKNKIHLSILRKHDRLIKSPQKIPCESYFNEVSAITKVSALDNALVERLKRKSVEVAKINSENNNDWEETAYQLLARYMGFKKNNEPLFELSKIVSIKLLKKHSDNLLQIEALLFGASGLINGNDQYVSNLKKEYRFLQAKYSLERSLNLAQWKFLRLRPANFPTIRIAQLAAIVKANHSLFSMFIENDVNSIVASLRQEVSDYWTEHYTFGKNSKVKASKLGLESAASICINVVAPILTAYSKHTDNQMFQNKAIELLSSLKAEKNTITRKMIDVGFESNSAQESQALIELFNNYCSKKKCLDCNIGAELIAP